MECYGILNYLNKSASEFNDSCFFRIENWIGIRTRNLPMKIETSIGYAKEIRNDNSGTC